MTKEGPSAVRQYRRGFVEGWIQAIEVLQSLIQEYGLNTGDASELCLEHGELVLDAWYSQALIQKEANQEPSPDFPILISPPEYPTFDLWLADQLGRGGPIGRLAKNVLQDEHWPAGARDYRAYQLALKKKFASHEVMLALVIAWNEFIRSLDLDQKDYEQEDTAWLTCAAWDGW